MKYYIIAGERSGDLHASNLMKELKKRDEQAEFRCWGGDEMEKAGGTLVRHYRETAFMGVLEVVANLNKIRGFLKECKQDILDYQPDVVVLVDYAGFNMKIAGFAKEHGFKTFYYISPKVWAWNQDRAKKIKKVVDRMFVIMHFEQDFYKKYDYEVDYVGNPLFDAISQFEPNEHFLEENGLSEDKPIIAILPGSRKQEVTSILHTMLSIVPKYRDQYEFVVAGVDNLPDELYAEARAMNMKIVVGKTYDLLSYAQSAVVTSGTATLETALFEVPQVVCYKTSWVTFYLAKLAIKVDFISLVNLIAGKEVVKELIQGEFTAENLEAELLKTLGGERDRILKDYAEMKALIKTEGTSKRTAALMTQYLTEKKSSI
ncbi:lipid-A-disaccharide synthase [Limibacter armeniacum]|uniref:lipid-A-disaccharide synthase n=1 Tax=Limibacter armeniacum TaxID=466084 RepID=UPI002FE68C88